jgi:hypothetical protein
LFFFKISDYLTGTEGAGCCAADGCCTGACCGWAVETGILSARVLNLDFEMKTVSAREVIIKTTAITTVIFLTTSGVDVPPKTDSFDELAPSKPETLAPLPT